MTRDREDKDAAVTVTVTLDEGDVPQSGQAEPPVARPAFPADTITVAASDAPTVLSVMATAETGDDATIVSERVDAVTDMGVARAPEDLALRVGDVVDDRFVLEKELGRGGMGAVFKVLDLIKQQAQDPYPYGALKIMTARLSENPEAWISLQREARKAQELAHPRIVTVYDFQIDRKSKLPFLYMEELSGEALDGIIKRNPQGLEDKQEALGIINGIAEGLEYAHSKGIVHSDLKPANVFITDDGGAKILDLGISRATPGSSDDVFDAGAMRALTPAYATCEMFKGAPPHPSNDLFALGIIACQLLTGRHPYRNYLDTPAPAVAALEAGAKVNRIPGIHRRQWQAIADCLKLDESQRPVDGADFLQRFRTGSRWPLYTAGALAVAAGAIVWSVWFQEGELVPSMPFEELPAAQQQAFTRAVEEGWTAHRFGDFNGALTFFVNAHDIHPHNSLAEEGLDQLVQDIIQKGISDEPVALERALLDVSTLMGYEAMAERRELVDYQRSLQQRLAQ